MRREGSRIVRYLGVGLLGAAIGAIGTILYVAPLIAATLRYPDSWKQIAHGQPRDEVLQKVPGAMSELWDIKGDFWEAPCPLGRWQMQVSYDAQQRVLHKSLSLYIGTRHDFRQFHFL